jgi:hypothetical protein
MASAELAFDAVLRGNPGLRHHASVVDDEVETVGQGRDFGGGGFDGGEGHEVERDEADGYVGVGMADGFEDFFELGLGAGGEEKERGGLGRDAEGDGGADGFGGYTRYEDLGCNQELYGMKRGFG